MVFFLERTSTFQLSVGSYGSRPFVKLNHLAGGRLFRQPATKLSKNQWNRVKQYFWIASLRKIVDEYLRVRNARARLRFETSNERVTRSFQLRSSRNFQPSVARVNYQGVNTPLRWTKLSRKTRGVEHEITTSLWDPFLPRRRKFIFC